MSAYLVSDETINVIAWGLFNYGVELKNVRPAIFVNDTIEEMGKVLLKQNYESLGARYGDDTTPHEYHFERPKKFNEGILLGCVQCYIYQACETPDFFESDIYKALKRLKDAMLTKMIEAKGLEIPWGVA